MEAGARHRTAPRQGGEGLAVRNARPTEEDARVAGTAPVPRSEKEHGSDGFGASLLLTRAGDPYVGVAVGA